MKSGKHIAITFQEFLNESVDVYHGSPYNFDTFSTDKISTGIGSQAFGWGIYFSDVRDIAKSYAETLETTAEVKIDNLTPSHEVAKLVSNIIGTHGKNRELALHILKSNAKKYLLDLKKITQEEYDLIMNAKKLTANRSRNIYQVQLHKGKTTDEYDYLVWTSNITDEQIKKIENQMKKENYSGRVSIEDGKIYKTIGYKEEIKRGGDVYSAFAGDKGFSPKEASLFLLRAGIDGIKVPGTGWDYIVFDPNSISINKKSRF